MESFHDGHCSFVSVRANRSTANGWAPRRLFPKCSPPEAVGASGATGPDSALCPPLRPSLQHASGHDSSSELQVRLEMTWNLHRRKFNGEAVHLLGYCLEFIIEQHVQQACIPSHSNA